LFPFLDGHPGRAAICRFCEVTATSRPHENRGTVNSIAG